MSGFNFARVGLSVNPSALEWLQESLGKIRYKSHSKLLFPDLAARENSDSYPALFLGSPSHDCPDNTPKETCEDRNDGMKNVIDPLARIAHHGFVWALRDDYCPPDYVPRNRVLQRLLPRVSYH